MAKTKIEKIAGIEEEIRQLENKRRQLVQAQKAQERKDRTKRLIERGAILESLIEGAADLDNEQIKAILQTALSSRHFTPRAAAETEETETPEAE